VDKLNKTVTVQYDTPMTSYSSHARLTVHSQQFSLYLSENLPVLFRTVFFVFHQLCFTHSIHTTQYQSRQQ